MAPTWFTGELHRPFDLQAGSGRALLIHGFMATPGEMRSLGRVLHEQNISVRGIQLPGFGADVARLATVRAHDWIQAAEQAWSEVADEAERSILVGFSMGAAVALLLAERRRPNRLVLLAPYWRLGTWRASLLPILKYIVPDRRIFSDASFDDPNTRTFLQEAMPGVDLDAAATRQRLQREARLPLRVLDELRKLVLQVGPALPRVTAPTLVVHGLRDQVVPRKDTRELVRRIGGPVSLHEIEADHLLIRDNRPSWPTVASLVKSFVDDR